MPSIGADRVAHAAFDRDAHAFRIFVVARVFVVAVGLAHKRVDVSFVVRGEFVAERDARFFVGSRLTKRVRFTHDGATVLGGSSA